MTGDSNETAIRTLIDDWSTAICEGDLERAVAGRADDVVMFDVPEPVQAKGIDAYRDTWKLFFASNPAGPERFRISELKIVADDQVAFAHGLLTIGGGIAHCRLTLGMRKVGDRWCVVHEHHSMPSVPKEVPMSELTTMEVITLFVRDIVEAKTFYRRVFEPETVYEDEVSCVLKFAGALVNLLDHSQAHELVRPAKVASSGTVTSALFTIKVVDVDLVCAQIEARGVTLLNGPVDRPWGRRTAAFADPSGHVWEVAQVLR